MRELYVPVSISWDAQVEHAQRLLREETEDEVLVHAHGYAEYCTGEGHREGCKVYTKLHLD